MFIELNARRNYDPGLTMGKMLRSCPAIRDLQMYLEMFGMCFRYFPLVRTEIQEAHNKYIKKEMKKGLVTSCAHHQALINEQTKNFVSLLFSGLQIRQSNALANREKIIQMINREFVELKTKLMDPDLLNLHSAIQKYAKNFGRLFECCLFFFKTFFTFSILGHSSYEVYKPFEYVKNPSKNDLAKIYAKKSKIHETDKKYCYFITRDQFLATFDNCVRPIWFQKFNVHLPAAATIIQEIHTGRSEWKLSFAKSICNSDNGFSSGVVHIGDCVLIENPDESVAIIELTKVF